jgi:hypothetical protein
VDVRERLGNLHDRSAGEDTSTLQDILQFSNVAWPGIGYESVHVLLPYAFEGLRQFALKVLKEMGDDERDVLASLTERRNVDRQDVQSVEEIFPEAMVGDLLHQVPIGGGDQPYIDVDRPGASDALEFMLLQHPQQFDLRIQGQISDFVEKERALVSQLEASYATDHRAGERATFVAEELTLYKRLRDRAAVHPYHRTVPPGAKVVQRSRDQLLPGAAFPGQENAGIRRSGLSDRPEHLLDHRTAADDLLEAAVSAYLFLEVAVLDQEAVIESLDPGKELGGLDCRCSLSCENLE